jgi:excisionase family DNA binding protein
MNAIPGYHTVEEAATILNVSKQRVRQLISDKLLRNARRVGPALVIPETEVQRRKELYPPRRKQRLSPKPAQSNGNGHK